MYTIFYIKRSIGMKKSPLFLNQLFDFSLCYKKSPPI